MFTDWRSDPDERLDGAGTEVAEVLCAAARRGVMVKGLLRSHLDGRRFSERENRHMGDDIEGGRMPPHLSRWTKAWATPLYRGFYDPDGRPAARRRADAF